MIIIGLRPEGNREVAYTHPSRGSLDSWFVVSFLGTMLVLLNVLSVTPLCMST